MGPGTLICFNFHQGQKIIYQRICTELFGRMLDKDCELSSLSFAVMEVQKNDEIDPMIEWDRTDREQQCSSDQLKI